MILCPTPIREKAPGVPSPINTLERSPLTLPLLKIFNGERIMLGIPWNPIRAILLSSIRSLLPAPKQTRSIPVFMMLPLDTALPNPTVPPAALQRLLQKLSKTGAKGVMLDVWWGICEKSPCDYDFTPYIDILNMIDKSDLKAQAVMSFHACGGNVGDTVNIPLPDWVTKAADDVGAWFQDREGYQSHEYLSFGVDDLAFLPGASGKRTPVQAYTHFVDAFDKAVLRAGLADVLVEIQVGLGPCGELRYPSYPLAQGRWEFPGIGHFQCYDKYLLQSLTRQHGDEGTRDVCLPLDAGGYNDKPWNTKFFRRGRKPPAKKLFLDWYSSQLLQHGEKILGSVKSVTSIQLAVKISGIHWWYHHSSRAAECTTGYINSSGSNYSTIAALCAKYDAVLDFTCLEMRSVDQWLWARCGPRQLVCEVFDEAFKAGVRVSGENALERWDRKAFRQVIRSFRRTKAAGVGYTHLRLSDKISEDGWRNFERFVRRMHEAK